MHSSSGSTSQLWRALLFRSSLPMSCALRLLPAPLLQLAKEHLWLRTRCCTRHRGHRERQKGFPPLGRSAPRRDTEKKITAALLLRARWGLWGRRGRHWGHRKGHWHSQGEVTPGLMKNEEKYISSRANSSSGHSRNCQKEKMAQNN